MSQLAPSIVRCPRCGETRSQSLFVSLDADTLPAHVQEILDGTFEQQTCAACQHVFRPEHRMLFAGHADRLWIVMYPLAERADYAALEDAVVASIAAQLETAPSAAAQRLRGLRPRLVFGQHMLSEAVRVGITGMDAAALECAKLLAIRRNLPALMAHGPFELCLERLDDATPVCAIHALPDGERQGELRLAPEIFAEVQAHRAEIEAQFPALFHRAYVSASRYLLEATL